MSETGCGRVDGGEDGRWRGWKMEGRVWTGVDRGEDGRWRGARRGVDGSEMGCGRVWTRVRMEDGGERDRRGRNIQEN